MNFMIFFNSLGELLYEVMSWLVFYPLTLWRAVVHPWSMMRYADAELADTAEQRFADVLSPPMFLLITVLIGHGVELAVIGADPILKSTKGLAALITDDSNLIGLRMIAFATFPLMSSVRLVRRKGQKLDRNSLKLPFYSQCYATAPMALLVGIADALARDRTPWMQYSSLALLVVGVVWFLVIETGWFRAELGISRIRAFGNAMRTYLVSSVIVIVAVLLVEG